MNKPAKIYIDNEDIRSIGSTTPNPSPGAIDKVSIPLRLIRDIIFLCALIVIWISIESWATSTGNLLPLCISALAGFIAGFLILGTIHEWGHFSGARMTSAFAPITGLNTTLMFNFDMLENSRTQFLAMSMGGNITAATALCLVLWQLPNNTPALLAFKVGAITVTFWGVLPDTPVIIRSLRGLSNVDAWQPHYEHRARNRILTFVVSLIMGCAYIFYTS